MKICTINIPDIYIDCIKVLVDMGFYPSRSEAVRTALKYFLGKEGEIVEELDAENFKQLKHDQLKVLLQQKE